jgi:hypothetical protein
VRGALILIPAALSALSVWAQKATPAPRFEDFPVTEVFKGIPAAPHLVTPEENLYRTRIREGVSKGWGVYRDGKEQSAPGPNFAGHYIAVEWGCGTGCLMMVFVHAETGSIYYPPISLGNVGTEKIGLPFFGLRSADFEFRLNSRLMTISACPDETNRRNAPCFTYYFLWDDNRWNLLRQERLSWNAP